MKKFLALFILMISLCGFTCSAETQWYNSKSYAWKQINSYGYWTGWSNWIACNVNIKFDLNTDWITIYSNKTQYYKVTTYHGTINESDGSQQAYFTAADTNGGVATIRLRIETNGNSQIYVEYSNAMWVYNVIRTR